MFVYNVNINYLIPAGAGGALGVMQWTHLSGIIITPPNL